MDPLPPQPVTVDARGLMCPEPIGLAEERARQLPPQTTMEVLATDLAAPIDFEAWCVGKGHTYLGVTEEDGYLRIRVRLVAVRVPG